MSFAPQPASWFLLQGLSVGKSPFPELTPRVARATNTVSKQGAVYESENMIDRRLFSLAKVTFRSGSRAGARPYPITSFDNRSPRPKSKNRNRIFARQRVIRFPRSLVRLASQSISMLRVCRFWQARFEAHRSALPKCLPAVYYEIVPSHVI